MGWPMSQDYNEAIQSPARHFADPDLRRGQPAVSDHGIPLPCSGNFADVYQVRCPDGTCWAVKCFTREVPGLRERYREISRHLLQARLPFTVDFTYLDEGIEVGGSWFPVLKMQWVEGRTLNEFVARSAGKPAVLEGLLQIWARMGQHLRAAELAHGDLQHGNVLLVRDANAVALKLVDYDGMWVPALAGSNSGEVGHPAYQHPQRLREGTYGPEVDGFPLLLVATALCALQTGGRELWAQYDTGDNLLFRDADLQAPTKSLLFLRLLRSGDARTVALAKRLIDALRGGLASAPLLDEVMPDLRPVQALVPLAKAAGNPAVGSRGLVPPPVRVAVTGTRIGSNTSGVNGLGDEVSQWPAGGAEPTNANSTLGDLFDGIVPSKKAIWDHESAEPLRLPWWKRPGLVAVSAGAALALIVLALFVYYYMFRPSPPSPPGTGKVPPGGAFIVLAVNPPGAEVLLDGKTRINIPADNRPIEIPVAPGKHTLRISKPGFEDFLYADEFKAGKSAPIKVELVKVLVASPGFTLLFNGKDRIGWNTREKLPVDWQVVNGVLIGSGRAHSYCYTARSDYKDFHLRLEVSLRVVMPPSGTLKP